MARQACCNRVGSRSILKHTKLWKVTRMKSNVLLGQIKSKRKVQRGRRNLTEPIWQPVPVTKPSGFTKKKNKTKRWPNILACLCWVDTRRMWSLSSGIQTKICFSLPAMTTVSSAGSTSQVWMIGSVRIRWISTLARCGPSILAQTEIGSQLAPKTKAGLCGKLIRKKANLEGLSQIRTLGLSTRYRGLQRETTLRQGVVITKYLCTKYLPCKWCKQSKMLCLN